MNSNYSLVSGNSPAVSSRTSKAVLYSVLAMGGLLCLVGLASLWGDSSHESGARSFARRVPYDLKTCDGLTNYEGCRATKGKNVGQVTVTNDYQIEFEFRVQSVDETHWTSLLQVGGDSKAQYPHIYMTPGSTQLSVRWSTNDNWNTPNDPLPVYVAPMNEWVNFKMVVKSLATAGSPDTDEACQSQVRWSIDGDEKFYSNMLVWNCSATDTPVYTSSPWKTAMNGNIRNIRMGPLRENPSDSDYPMCPFDKDDLNALLFHINELKDEIKQMRKEF